MRVTPIIPVTPLMFVTPVMPMTGALMEMGPVPITLVSLLIISNWFMAMTFAMGVMTVVMAAVPRLRGSGKIATYCRVVSAMTMTVTVTVAVAVAVFMIMIMKTER